MSFTRIIGVAALRRQLSSKSSSSVLSSATSSTTSNSSSNSSSSTSMSFLDQLAQQKDSSMRQAIDAVRELPISSARIVEKAAIDHAFDTFNVLRRRGTVATLSELKLLLKTIIKAKAMLNTTTSSSTSAAAVAKLSRVNERLRGVMKYVDESLILTDVEYWNLIATLYVFERKPSDVSDFLFCSIGVLCFFVSLTVHIPLTLM